MSEDFFELDFLAVETAKSGDAICSRIRQNGIDTVYVIDGGYAETGPRIVEHIRNCFDRAPSIDHMVLTHPDGDHARGLQEVIQSMTVQRLWMNRPWLYAAELLPRFPTYSSAERLESRLRALYPNVAVLEDLALERGIQISEVFQGQNIGNFIVLSPSRQTFLDLIVELDRTPEGQAPAPENALAGFFEGVAKAVTGFVKALWGEENFSSKPTSAENEMSVVQYCNFGGQSFLLTGDAGRRALKEAADYAEFIGIPLPGIDRFQIPHHGSRRNFSTELADRWLGPRQASSSASRDLKPSLAQL